jgi:transcriptional regulator with XRE-family HTH domain
METFGQKLRDARKAKGMSQKDAEFELRSLLEEPMWIDQSKISRFENGSIGEGQADPYAVEWLCAIYGVEVEDVSGLIAKRLRKARNELAKKRRAQGLRASRWNPDSLDTDSAGHSAGDFILDLTDEAIARGEHPDCWLQPNTFRAA